MSTPYDHRYPSIADLKAKAKKRMPLFAFDYLTGGIDEEQCKQRNRQSLQDIKLVPRYCKDVRHTDMSTELFGQKYQMGFGVAPVGLGNMMWPGAEKAIASAAQAAGIPYVLSTYSTTELEQIAELAPDVCWFQLYVHQDEEIMKDLIKRAKDAGFKALMITLDIPVGAKRNRELRNGLKMPFRVTPKMIWQVSMRPNWALGTLIGGTPDFVNVLRYGGNADMDFSEFITKSLVHGVTIERLKLIRSLWDGPLILKGVQFNGDFQNAIDIGVDGVVISNHGGRQLDAAPSSIDTLRSLPDQCRNQLTVMLDSGIRTGLDVVRARALGAEACFSGRSFFYGVGALGARGASHVVGLYQDEISRTLKQIGCDSFSELDSGWLG